MPTAADWTKALAHVSAAAASGVAAVRGDALLLRVAPAAAFHPLLALLPRGFVLVLRLHARVAALLQQAAGDGQRQALLETLVFEENADAAVAGASHAPRDHQQQLALATPRFSDRSVAASGVLRAFAADEPHAKAVLADITRALQSDEHDALDELTVVVEHDDGYEGLQLRGRVVASAIHVELAPLAAAAAAEATLDSVLDAYEAAFRDQMELRGVDEQPQRLDVRVRAGFAVAAPPPVAATLLSSWGGIENVRALLCKPPPNSTSLLCIESCGGGSGEASGGERRAAKFPRQLQETVAFLAMLSSSTDDAPTRDVDMDDADPAQMPRQFRRFLSSPDAAQDDTVDLNSTLELNLALDVESASASRSNLDFLEKMWDFALRHARSADAAAALVHECVAMFAAARTIPFVHPSNDTHLGAFLKTSAIASSSSEASGGSAASLRELQTQLSSRQEAVDALVELGEWKMRRDVAAWFVQIGFTAAESARIVEHFEVQNAAASLGHPHAALQQLVDVCAAAHSLGTTGSLLRRLANDCLGCFARLGGREAAEVDAPSFVLPLNSFIPERTRANVGDVFFWDVDMSFGDLTERTVRICEASFQRKSLPFSSRDDEGANSKLPAPALSPRVLDQLRRRLPREVLLLPEVQAFVQEAAKAFEDKLPVSTGLVQLTCTVRSLLL